MNLFKKIGESSLFSRATPQFWHVKNSLASEVLIPLSVIYFFARRLFHSRAESKSFNAKIICIGNAIAGGSGKTPAAIAVAESLQKLKPEAKIAFISTGFKAALRGPLQVDPATHNSRDVGDEALILSRHYPVIICKERIKAVEYAVSNGFDHLILDDGMHDNSIKKDATFLVIDGKYGFGNGLVLPAGPLRDRLDYAVKGTNAIILIGEDSDESLKRIKYAAKTTLPVIHAHIKIQDSADKDFVYMAFAGIGRPQKFFDMLKNDMGLVLAETMEFADHYSYDNSDLEMLQQRADKQKAKLITTEKDYVKLPSEFASNIICIKIKLAFDYPDEIEGALKKL